MIPKLENAATLRLFATQAWPQIKEVFETQLGCSPLVTPSSFKDLQDPDLRTLIDKYYRGTDITAEERTSSSS